jgi:hypothetical protein
MNKAIGIQSDDTSFVSSRLLEGIPDLRGVIEIFVISRSMSQGNLIEPDKVRDVIATIPITAPFLGLNIYESVNETNNSIEYNAPTDLRNIDIRLEDSNGRLVNLQNHRSQFVFKIYT